MFASRLFSVFAFTLGLVVCSAAAPGDEAKTEEKPKSVDKAKGPDFSGYQWVAMVTGEVVKADETKVTLRVFWEQASTTGGKKHSGRPSLHGNHGRTHHSPYAMRRPNFKVTVEHHDYEIPYLAESLARTKTLPVKFDSDGKRGFYSAKEQDELSVPYAAPGYQAVKADITPGTIIEAHIIRDKAIAANKMTDADMRLKYAVILRHDPNPPKDIASPSPSKKN